MAKKVGFIGLGNMGSRMSKNVMKAAGSLLVFDLNPKAVAELKAAGADFAASGAQVAKECDVIFLSLPAPAHVKSVVAGAGGLLENSKKGQYILDLSTVDPKTSETMSQAAAEKGVTYVDVPVSGGVSGAAAGTLSLMAGATEDELSDVKPYIDAIGTTKYVGRRGIGSALKLINNFMAFSHLVADAEGIAMADHLGIDMKTFFDVVLHSSGYDKPLESKVPKIMNDDYNASFTIKLVLKDLELAAQLCRDCTIPNFTVNQAIQFYRLAELNGYGDKDTISIVKMLRDIEPVK